MKLDDIKSDDEVVEGEVVDDDKFDESDEDLNEALELLQELHAMVELIVKQGGISHKRVIWTRRTELDSMLIQVDAFLNSHAL